MNREEIRTAFNEKVNYIFGLVKDYDVEVDLNFSKSALTRFANNTIHQNVSVDNGRIGIRLQKGKKSGKVSINLSSADSVVKSAVEKAKEIVKCTSENEETIPMVEPQEYRENEKFCSQTAELSPNARADIVSDAVSRCEQNNLSAAGIVENSATAIGISNSKGLSAYWDGTNFEFSLTAEGSNGTGWAQSMGWSIHRTSPDDDIEEAVNIAIRNQNPREIQPGKYTVVLTPAAVADVIAFMSIYGFNARMHLEGRSFLTGKLGQKVFSDKLNIYDDAYDDNWSGLPFDFEGLPRQSIQLVRDGVLTNLVADRWTAEKMDIQPTGHGLPQPNQWGAIPLNIIISPGEKSTQQLINSVQKGLLVTHFHYTNISELSKLTITGMTRDGLFVIQNGEIAYPVKNLRFTQSALEAFNNIVEIGSERKLVSGFFFGGAYTPGMIIDNFNFSSTTEFGG